VGRELTDVIRDGVRTASWRAADGRRRTAAALRAFTRMFRPHEAREGTVVFPRLPVVLGVADLDTLGERIAREERARFGSDGMMAVVHRVSALELPLGLYRLEPFTASVPHA
jgi:hypothetical protein